jgi:sugar O-acyltransferase (sialic acid O-acetyltransferase NeuD family)
VLESKAVYIFGYSGHAYVVIETLQSLGYNVVGYFDYEKAEKNPYFLDYFGFEKEVDVKSIVKDNFVFPAVGNNAIRKKLVTFFDKNHLNQITVIDPSANVSKTAGLGTSTYVGKNVIVNAHAHIGNGVILNTGCIIEHECHIKNGVHIAPSSVLCGNVSLGALSFIGAHSVVIPNTSIANDVLVGAGSVVVENLENEGTYFGNPARIKK